MGDGKNGGGGGGDGGDKKKAKTLTEHHKAVRDAIKKALQNLDAFLAKVPGFEEMEKATKFSRLYIFFYIIGGIILLSMVAQNNSGDLITHAFGFLAGLGRSLKAAESGKKEDFQKWLSFWIVFSFLSLLEFAEQGAMKVYVNVLKQLSEIKLPSGKKPEKPAEKDPLAHRFGGGPTVKKQKEDKKPDPLGYRFGGPPKFGILGGGGIGGGGGGAAKGGDKGGGGGKSKSPTGWSGPPSFGKLFQ